MYVHVVARGLSLSGQRLIVCLTSTTGRSVSMAGEEGVGPLAAGFGDQSQPG